MPMPMHAGLALKRWMREGVFAGIALGGSALLNLGTKQLFARERSAYLHVHYAKSGCYACRVDRA